MPELEFTTDWFTRFANVWLQILERTKPAKLLEIGSYEGRSSCFLIERCASDRPIELHCVDTWDAHVGADAERMVAVEARFDRNIAAMIEAAPHPVRFEKHRALSHDVLSRLLASGHRSSFDWIYIDGSHEAPDVLSDAVLSFRLLKVGGVLVFDDYLWSFEPSGRQDFYNMAKPAIDAFVNIYQRKLSVFGAPLYQLYMSKTAE